VAWHFASVFNACLIEVCETASYARLTRFLVWCKMARGEKKTTIEPSSPDVAEYDLVVFGSPVWAFKPTPLLIAWRIVRVNRLWPFPLTVAGRVRLTKTFKKWIESRGMFRLLSPTSPECY
jgi:hypothetical protein